MKVAVCSDVHLEFGELKLENPGDVEVLVLSGDICVASDLRTPDPYGILSSARTDRFHQFMASCSSNFPFVVYVMGNHEHYHGDFALSASTIRNHLKEFPNIFLLDKETCVIGDTVFVGGTLWTDMNNEDPITLHSMSSMMNDFRCVKNSNRYTYRNVPLYKHKEDGINYELDEFGKMIQIGMKKKEEVSRFSPEDAVVDHRAMLDYLKVCLDNSNKEQKFVVCGHHAPSKKSTHPRYAHETVMNGGYSTDLEQFITDHPQIKLWTHGHTHEDFDYMVGETRIVCNPRGYIGYEERADRFALKVVEV